MDWQTLLSIVGIILFVVLMMRGCGGMMAGGGCGMGGRQSRRKQPEHESEPGSTGPSRRDM